MPEGETVSRMPRRSIRIHVAIQILSALTALLAIQVLAFEFYARWDFSRSQKFALAEQTKRVIRKLDQPLRITVFFSRTTLSPASMLYLDVQNLMKEFVFSGRNRIHVEYVDPVRDLSRARELQGKHKFRADENVLILEYDGRTAFLPVAEMADFDLSPMETGGRPRVLAFNGEASLTAAMLGLVSPDPKKIYFLEGLGEPPLSGPDSAISRFRDYLARQNAVLESLNPGVLDAIPADADAVFLIAPMVDPEERVIQLLAGYWKRGGRLMILLEPTAATPRLDALCAQMGLRPRDDRVLRTVRLGFATGILREVTCEFSPGSEITRRLAGLSLFLPGQTRSIALEPADNLAMRPLLQPMEEFWGETDYVTDSTRGVRYDDGRDTGQPLYVAGSSARGGTADDRLQVGSSKLVLVGSSEFALDAALSGPGLDFLVSCAHWLTDRSHLVGEVPKPERYFVLNFSDRQLGLLSLVSLGLLPGLAALVALLIWLRRRAG